MLRRAFVLLVFCPEGEVVREVEDGGFQEDGVEVLVGQAFEEEPFKNVRVIVFVKGEPIATGKQIRLGDIQKEVDAELVIVMMTAHTR